MIAARAESPLVAAGRLRVRVAFPYASPHRPMADWHSLGRTRHGRAQGREPRRPAADAGRRRVLGEPGAGPPAPWTKAPGMSICSPGRRPARWSSPRSSRPELFTGSPPGVAPHRAPPPGRTGSGSGSKVSFLDLGACADARLRASGAGNLSQFPRASTAPPAAAPGDRPAWASNGTASSISMDCGTASTSPPGTAPCSPSAVWVDVAILLVACAIAARQGYRGRAGLGYRPRRP